MKEYQTLILNGYTIKEKLDKLLNDLAMQGYTIYSTLGHNIIIMERDRIIKSPED